MVKFLVLRVKLGKLRLEDVPKKYKKEVEQAIKSEQGE